MKVASIDIGSNTVRLMIAEKSADGVLSLIMRKRVITRLAKGLDSSGTLDQGRVEHTLETLVAYAEHIRAESVPNVLLAGTSAIREAQGAPTFMARARELTGYTIRVLSTRDEARISGKGVLYSFPDVSEALIVDIGGGSTEGILVSGGDGVAGTSIPVGVVKLVERHLHNNPPTVEEMTSLKDHCASAAGRMIAELGAMPGTGLKFIGTAGTPTTVAAIDLSLKEYDRSRVTGHETGIGTMRTLLETLAAMPSKARLDVVGMEKGREDLIIPGLTLTIEIMESVGAMTMTACDTGLLEGLCLEPMGNDMTGENG